MKTIKKKKAVTEIIGINPKCFNIHREADGLHDQLQA